MKLRYIIYLVISLLTTSMVSGCSDSDGRITDEGVITYKLECPKTWEQNKKFDNLLTLFPKTIGLYFKNNNTALVINGILFQIKYLSNYAEGRNYTTIRIGTDKVMSVQDSSQTAFGYNDMEDLKYTYTSDTMTIAGYLCKKAIVECTKRESIKMDVWYTQNIKIANGNSNNAFRNLDGVPMKFDILLMNFYMKLEAVDVDYGNVKDETFAIPSDYTIGTKQDLKDLMNHYMRNN